MAKSASNNSDKAKKNLFNFTLAGLPELEHFPDAATKQAALKAIEGSVGWKEWLVGIGLVVVVAVAVQFLLRYLLRAQPITALHGELGDSLRIILTFAAAIGTIRFLHRWGAGTFLRGKLLEAGVPVCLPCGYLLRGLPAETTKCPECGKAIDERARTLLSVPEADLAIDSQER
jgi:hypothetical protein